MSHEILSLLDRWVEAHVIRPIDRGFAAFLLQQDPTGDLKVILAGALTSWRLGLGHVCLDPLEFLSDPVGFLQFGMSEDSQEAMDPVRSEVSSFKDPSKLSEWVQAFQASKLISQGTDGCPLVFDGGCLYLARNWRHEQVVAQRILERIQETDPSPFSEKAELERLFPPRNPPIPGPNHQKIATALATRGKFLILTGGPGTGKTFTVVRMLALLLSKSPNLRILLGAPTGKAAARLTESIMGSLKTLPESIREKIPTKASTIHQMLGSRKNTRQFRHHARNPLHADVVVIDEASMIDLERMAALMDAVPPSARLILVGDKDQLSSVEAGSVMGDLCRDLEMRGYSAETTEWIQAATGENMKAATGQRVDALAQQTVMLRHSERFAGHSGIGQLAEAVNFGDIPRARAILTGDAPYPDVRWIQTPGPGDRLLDALCHGSGSPAEESDTRGYRQYLEMIPDVIKTEDFTPEALTIFFNQLLEALGGFQVLSAVHEGPWGVESLNLRIERRLEKQGLIQTAMDPVSGWYAGRPVMVTRNDYELGLMNGDVGMTLPFLDEREGKISLRVVFKHPENTDTPFRIVLPGRLTEVETVFAMTVHKSQGSEFGHVALMLPNPSHAPVLSRELVYTGITRARHHLTVIGENVDEISSIINRKTRRSGRLGDLLQGWTKMKPEE